MKVKSFFLFCHFLKFLFLSFLKDPTIPNNYTLLASVPIRVYNQFSLQIQSSLLVGTSGPVTYVGVLVTEKAPGGFSFLFFSYCQRVL